MGTLDNASTVVHFFHHNFKVKLESHAIRLPPNCNRRKSTRGVCLHEFIHHEHCYYTKQDIKEFQNHQWIGKVNTAFPEIGLTQWEETNSKLLFSKGSSREQNTLIAEFIHGHSLRFRNFRVNVGYDDCDTCEFCNEMTDSPEHQLFECPTFNSEERQTLLNLMEHNISDFKWKILIPKGIRDHKDAIELFKSMVYNIEKESERIWQECTNDSTITSDSE